VKIFTVVKLAGLLIMVASVFVDKSIQDALNQNFLFGLLCGGLLVDITHDLTKKYNKATSLDV
jgi:hypothetical protein